MEMNYLQWELTRVVAERDQVWRAELDQDAKRCALILCRMATSLVGGSADLLADVAPSSEEEKVSFRAERFESRMNRRARGGKLKKSRAHRKAPLSRSFSRLTAAAHSLPFDPDHLRLPLHVRTRTASRRGRSRRRRRSRRSGSVQRKSADHRASWGRRRRSSPPRRARSLRRSRRFLPKNTQGVRVSRSCATARSRSIAKC